MIELALQASLIITLVYVSLNWEGMVFFKLGLMLKFCFSSFLWTWLCKPLFTCMTCMCGVWGLVIWFAFGGVWEWDLLKFILIVGGINTIISCFIDGKQLENELNGG